MVKHIIKKTVFFGIRNYCYHIPSTLKNNRKKYLRLVCTQYNMMSYKHDAAWLVENDLVNFHFLCFIPTFETIFLNLPIPQNQHSHLSNRSHHCSDTTINHGNFLRFFKSNSQSNQRCLVRPTHRRRLSHANTLVLRWCTRSPTNLRHHQILRSTQNTKSRFHHA